MDINKIVEHVSNNIDNILENNKIKESLNPFNNKITSDFMKDHNEKEAYVLSFVFSLLIISSL